MIYHQSKLNNLRPNSFVWNINDASNSRLIHPQFNFKLQRRIWFKYRTLWQYICIRSWFLQSSSSNKAGRFLEKSLQRKSPDCFQRIQIIFISFLCHGRPTLALCVNAFLTSLPKCSPSQVCFRNRIVLDTFGQIHASVKDNLSLSSPVKYLLSILVTFVTLHHSANLWGETTRFSDVFLIPILKYTLRHWITDAQTHVLNKTLYFKEQLHFFTTTEQNPYRASVKLS